MGNPLEYKTSQKFLEVFGLSSLSELPSLRSLQMNIDDQKKAAIALNSLEDQQEKETTASEIGFASPEEV